MGQHQDLIDTTHANNQMTRRMIENNPHQLKTDHDKNTSYDEEELNMNEQSEEGTAVDYDSQAENPTTTEANSQAFGKQLNLNQSSLQQPKLLTQKSRELLTELQQSKRPSLHEFDEIICDTKRRRLDMGSGTAEVKLAPPMMKQSELARNFSNQLEFPSPLH